MTYPASAYSAFSAVRKLAATSLPRSPGGGNPRIPPHCALPPMTRKTLPVALIQEKQPRRCRGQPGGDRNPRGRGRQARRAAGAAAGTAQRRVFLPARIGGRIRPGRTDPRPQHRTPRQAGQAAWRGPGQLAVRAPRRRAVPQHRGRLRKGRQRRSASTARCTSRTTRVSTRSSTSPPAISASSRSTLRSAASACWCAGTSGIRKPRG